LGRAQARIFFKNFPFGSRDFVLNATAVARVAESPQPASPNFVICKAFEYHMSAPKKRPFHHRIAYRFFLKLQEGKPLPTDEFHILNAEEQAWISRVKRKAMLLAGSYGAIAVLLYYVPILIWDDWFSSFHIPLDLYFFEFKFEYLKQIYSLLIVIAELFMLTRINIWVVAEVANACGFPDRRDSNYDLHLEQLFTVGLESKNKDTLQFGIDPYEDTSRFTLFMFTLWNLLRATLANFFVKFVVVKTILRNELRQFADLVGVPVFFVWNAVATWRVIRAAEVYIMAPGLINELCIKVEALHDDEDFKQNIFDAMQYVVTVKRSFHHNHFILVKRLVDEFGLDRFKDMEPDRLAFLRKIKASPAPIKLAYSKLIVLGIIIDGGISWREARALRYLSTEGIISITPEQARQWCRDFRRGKGLDALINA
jgi:hypothetical protein